MATDYEVVVIGGGPAGLQAALTLGRLHRRVLLLDSGAYRNDPAPHLHNFITHDNRPPADLRALARDDLGAYETITVREAQATEVAELPGGFEVLLGGGEAVSTRLLLLATGVRDTLPDTPGLAALFGTVVAHCPFCHGHEYAGLPVAVLGSHAHVGRLAAMMAPIASELIVLADGGALDPESAAAVERLGATVRAEAVTGLCASSLGATVSFDSGPAVEVGGVLISTTLTPTAPFAAQLRLTTLESGCIEVDAMGRTSLPGVFAAGDAAHTSAFPMPMSSVLVAAAAGQLAGSACVAALLG